MKKFLDRDFLLHTETSRSLYHEVASNMPIIDYHCHLDPKLIAEDARFDNLTQVWLYGDHYKWRAMRANGVDERFCSGKATDREKFMKWAETVPDTLRNPLYHWTHMELQRYFGIEELLHPGSAEGIYEKAAGMLRSEDFSVRRMIRKMNVEVLCTTDDPIDDLAHHIQLAGSDFETRVLPTWRPDKSMAVEDVKAYNLYLTQLEEAADLSISNYMDLLSALGERHDFFHETGCRISDHGIETFYAADYDHQDIEKIFAKIRSGRELNGEEVLQFKSALLFELAVMDHEKGWTQQFHVGAIRNNNRRRFMELGPDKGYDSIGDFSMARDMSRLFDRLDASDQLAKTIVYNLNPADNALMATMVGNFSDGQIAGKMQFGSGWWFLDQKFGMQDQMNTLSSLGLLSRFVGMLTDSRSFLSYPRHEYFRRILCDLLGTDVENGEIPNDPEMLHPLVENVCYRNAHRYFGF